VKPHAAFYSSKPIRVPLQLIPQDSMPLVYPTATAASKANNGITLFMQHHALILEYKLVLTFFTSAN